MDALSNILEHIESCNEHRDNLLKAIEAEDAKIMKLEAMYYMLEDPATQDLMREVVLGVAVQNGVEVNGNDGGSGEKHYVGMARVRDYVKQIWPEQLLRCTTYMH